MIQPTTIIADTTNSTAKTGTTVAIIIIIVVDELLLPVIMNTIDCILYNGTHEPQHACKRVTVVCLLLHW